MKLRIHHIFDMIRDKGCEKALEPHPYGHSYHAVAQELFAGKAEPIELVVENDDVCRGCAMLKEGRCVDTIDHRRDYTSKQEFNDYLDRRIMKIMALTEHEKITLPEILEIAERYIENITVIYEGNDLPHTELRRQNVLSGIGKLKAGPGSR